MSCTWNDLQVCLFTWMAMMSKSNSQHQEVGVASEGKQVSGLLAPPGSAQQLSVSRLPWEPPPTPLPAPRLLSPAASGCGDPEGARVPFEVLFSRLRFGNNRNILSLRRRGDAFVLPEKSGHTWYRPSLFLCYKTLASSAEIDFVTSVTFDPSNRNANRSLLRTRWIERTLAC